MKRDNPQTPTPATASRPPASTQPPPPSPSPHLPVLESRPLPPFHCFVRFYLLAHVIFNTFRAPQLAPALADTLTVLGVALAATSTETRPVTAAHASFCSAG